MTALNDLPARLNVALGDAYRVEKELNDGKRACNVTTSQPTPGSCRW